jgi:hypothetical protein
MSRGALRLGWRLLTRRDLLQALAVVAIPMAILLTLFMTVSSLTLSPSQYSASKFGRFAGLVELGGTPKTSSHLPPESVVREFAAYAPAGQSALVVSSYDVTFAGMPAFTGTNYIEADWARQPFGQEFTVLAGRMPRRAGEIAVARGLVSKPLGRVVTAVSSHARLRIVGVISDRFSRVSSDVLAAPGTWASFDWRRLNRGGFSVDPTAQILGNFHSWDRLAVLSARYQASNRGGGGSDFETVNNRALVAANPPESFVQSEPLLYRVPATALAALCPLLLLGLRGRRARRWTGILRATGVRTVSADVAVMGGSALLVLVAVPVGAILGEVLGLLVRPLVNQVGNEPLSPPASVLAESVRFAAVAIAVTLAASVAMSSQQRLRSVREMLVRRPPARLVTGARWIVILLAVCAVSFFASTGESGTNNTQASVMLAVAACLAIPDLLQVIRRASRGRGVRWRLVSSRLMIDVAKSCAVCATLVVGLGPFVALSSENTANQAFQRASWDYQIPLGQVAVGSPPGGKSHLVDQQASKLVQHATGQQPIQVMELSSSPYYAVNPRYAMLAPDGRAPQQGQSLLAVNSLAALRQLLGTRLTPRAAAVAAGGGVLQFGPAPARAPIGIVQEANQGVALRRLTAPKAVASIENDHGWAEQGTGFVLASTARRLRLPMYTYYDAFTHISSAESRKLTKIMAAAGLPPQVLLQPSAFQAASEPPALVYGRYGILLLLAVVMTIAIGSTARSLRKESRSLVAIGVRGSWARRALALQSLTLTVIGLLGGLLVGGISFGIYTARIPGAPVAVPAVQLAIVAGGAIMIAMLTTWVFGRRLTPRQSSS